ncbi:hypothetical protein SAMN05444274_1247 [Mariniphaga anaerophila]|uniref:Uncharacterized protein n=1 Tax=Mariniphaga anaerophila TaxID=1484053 RepID=A0A1M5GJ04_9BACT|nr:hypothetical protein SAMN05444274_1247 [Mariniphaga anaerophila]
MYSYFRFVGHGNTMPQKLQLKNKVHEYFLCIKYPLHRRDDFDNTYPLRLKGYFHIN